MLNVRKTLSHVLDALKVDYVVETYKSAEWNYIKWNSGRIDFWRYDYKSSLSPDGTIAAGAYKLINLSLDVFTLTNLEQTAVSASCCWGTGLSWASVRDIGESTIQIAIFANNNITANSKIWIHGTGYWK